MASKTDATTPEQHAGRTKQAEFRAEEQSIRDALESELREQGIRVIESYPGAAQDILGIPRKGASLEELKWGLVRSGITGDFATTKVSHDEVDAITSALVGLFYLADDFIALGTPSEDYLIVPRSSKFNYLKLAQIVSDSGLDVIPETAPMAE